MSTDSDSQSSSSSQSAWWTFSSWVPDTTSYPSSTLPTSTLPTSDLSLTPTETDPPTSSWTEIGISTITDSATSPTLAPSSTSAALIVMSSSISSLSGSIETLSHADSTRQSPKSTPPVRLKTAHIVGMSFGAFVGLLAIGTLLFYFFIRLGRRRHNHRRVYSDPEEKHDDDLATKTWPDSRGNDFGDVIRGRDSLGERMPSHRILDRSYYNERRSFSDGGATSTTPLLQPSLSQSDNRGLELDTSGSFILSDVYESPISQFRSPGSFEEEFPEPSSPSCPPPYSRILPLPPILRPPRPLPVPTNPRPLQPQRRFNSIQVRMQTKPPLISSSTVSLPLFPSSSGSGSSPSSSYSSSSPSSPPSFPNLRNTDPLINPVLEQLPPLLPQRRTEESIKYPPSSWSSSSLSPVTPFRPTPSVSFKDVPHPNNPKPKKLKIRRKDHHARNRSGQSGSQSLTSESFRCAGEKAMKDEDSNFFAHEGVLGLFSSTMRTTERGTLIDT